jgi:tetrahydromethanopterin S-methyltransferase subunit G
MNQPKRIADAEKFKRIHQRFQEVNRQLDIWNLKLEQLNAMMEVELCQQRLERIETRKKQTVISESKD